MLISVSPVGLGDLIAQHVVLRLIVACLDLGLVIDDSIDDYLSVCFHDANLQQQVASELGINEKQIGRLGFPQRSTSMCLVTDLNLVGLQIFLQRGRTYLMVSNGHGF